MQIRKIKPQHKTALIELSKNSFGEESWTERQLEERMQRHSSRINGSNARRSQHHILLFRRLANIFQEGRLSRSGFSRQK